MSQINPQDNNITHRFSGEWILWFIITLILCLAVSQGILQAMNVPESLPKAAMEVLSIGLLLLAIRSRRNAGQPILGLQYLMPLAIAVFAGLLSGWVYGAGMLEYALFTRTLISPVVIFLAVINMSLPAVAMRRIVLLLCFLFLVQLPIVGWKALEIGINEKFWIGSLSQTAGQLGLLFPLLALSLLVPLYLHNGGKLLAILVLAFSFIPVINEKRAVIFVLPAFFCAAVFIYSFLWKRQVAFVGMFDRFPGMVGKRFLVLIFISAAVIVSAVGLIPSFQTIQFVDAAGSAATSTSASTQSGFSRVMRYSNEYLTRDYSSPLNASAQTVGENTNIQLGRLAFIKAAFESVTEHGPLIMMFGYGASEVNPSYLLGEGRSDVMYRKLGIRGTFPSAIAVMLEAGLVGLSAMVLFFGLLMFSVMMRVGESAGEDNLAVGVAVILMTLTMVFDYFVYSITAWSSYTLAPIFFIVLGLFLAHHTGIADQWPMARGKK